jgi:bacillithiol biosynthesis deacetylase BshB1
MKCDVLAFGAHPDDIELGAGGSIAKMTHSGARVAMVDLTRGELGTRGTPEMRDEEARNAAAILGVTHRHNLGLRDGFFQNDESSKRAVIEQIRRFQPNIVLANTPKDRHPDHGRGSELVREAVFLSGLAQIKTSWQGVDQQSWRPSKLYYYLQFYEPLPDLIVDISGYEHLRMDSVLAHKSQVYDPNSSGPQTVISSKAFLDSVHFRSANWGRQIGVPFGEAFEVERTIGVRDLRDLI